MGYRKEDVKEALLEIIDALICILEGEECNSVLKKSLHRFCQTNRGAFIFPGSAPYVRLTTRRKIGFICTYSPEFQVTRESYESLVKKMGDHHDLSPEKHEELAKEDAECERALRKAMDTMPIEECEDRKRLVEAFEVMRHWVHFHFSQEGWSSLFRF